jgi:hypothetical protein
MAAIPVTIIGTMTYSDVGVGGGPMPGGPTPMPPIYYPPQQPPGVWPSPGVPTHPIAPGGQPPEVWPGPGQPAHPIAPGGAPPGIWPSPGYPAHPIAPGGGPSQGPGFPTPPIYIPITPPPDSGLSPEHPIYVPVYPSHPISNAPSWDEIKDFVMGNPPGRPHPEAT